MQRAVELLWSAKRPLFISGRGARGAGPQLARLLERLNALYLDTGESRGLVPDDHPSVVAAMRGSVMSEADLVVTVGRRLDFQLAYGSPAVFGDAKFLRIADCAGELRDNRRGAVELLATPAEALEAILQAGEGRSAATDRQWARPLRAKHVERADKLRGVDEDRARRQRRPDAPEPACSPRCARRCRPTRSSSPTAATS